VVLQETESVLFDKADDILLKYSKLISTNDDLLKQTLTAEGKKWLQEDFQSLELDLEELESDLDAIAEQNYATLQAVQTVVKSAPEIPKRKHRVTLKKGGLKAKKFKCALCDIKLAKCHKICQQQGTVGIIKRQQQRCGCENSGPFTMPKKKSISGSFLAFCRKHCNHQDADAETAKSNEIESKTVDSADNDHKWSRWAWDKKHPQDTNTSASWKDKHGIEKDRNGRLHHHHKKSKDEKNEDSDVHV
jgi:hypothetical protein